MKNNFILHLRTKEMKKQSAFESLLMQENISFKLLCRWSRNENDEAYYQIEGLYCISSDWSILSSLKRIIDTAIESEALELYKCVSW